MILRLYYVQRNINIHKYFLIYRVARTRIHAPKTKIFPRVMIHFSENTSSVNISLNVLEQSLMEIRHPTSRPKFSLLLLFLFPLKSWRYYKLEVDSSNERRFKVEQGLRIERLRLFGTDYEINDNIYFILKVVPASLRSLNESINRI